MASFCWSVLALAEDMDSKPRDILDLSLYARETFPEKVLIKKKLFNNRRFRGYGSHYGFYIALGQVGLWPQQNKRKQSTSLTEIPL